ncbi:MAG: FAD-dependent thymidylate synthase [Nanoarchaeota archaeon]
MPRNKYESLREVPEKILDKVSKYITNIGADTFVIQGLPSELTGGLLARYSRAKTGLQLTLINEFLDENGNPSQEKGTELMDRVLNSFGDDSVGELENVTVGFENISQVFTKEIEDRRIGGSPIEQSTRYVKYDQKDSGGRWRYLRPKEITGTGLEEKFEKVNNRAFEVYSEGIAGLSEFFKKEFPREKYSIKVERDGNQSEVKETDLKTDEEKAAFRNAYNFTIRCAALDVGRCVLPSSTLTHIGENANGRFYSNLLTHLKSSELEESRERALKLEEELNKVIPTFIKRNRVNEYVKEVRKEMLNFSLAAFSGIKPEAESVSLVGDADYLDLTVSSSIFPFTNISLPQILKRIERMPEEKKFYILDLYKGDRKTRRDRSGRGLEAGYPLTFDLVGGFAEYRDLERHRMVTQQRQMLTTDLGFIMPSEMIEVGLEKKVGEVVDAMSNLNGEMKKAGLQYASQYATLFNNRMRFMMGMNLREFQHLSELRTQPAGHYSYRAMTMEMAKKVALRYPWAEKFYEFVDYSDPGNKISRAKEQSKIAGKNLASGISGEQDF